MQRKSTAHLLYKKRLPLVQIAWAASKTKTYLGMKYKRIAAKKRRKKALIALARKILVICYHMLDRLKPYEELRMDFLEKLKSQDKMKCYLSQLKKLGYDVCIEKAP